MSSMVGYRYVLVHVLVLVHVHAGRCIFPYSSLAASTVVQAYFLFSLIYSMLRVWYGASRGLIVGLLGHYNVKLTGIQPKGTKNSQGSPRKFQTLKLRSG